MLGRVDLHQGQVDRGWIADVFQLHEGELGGNLCQVDLDLERQRRSDLHVRWSGSSVGVVRRGSRCPSLRCSAG